MIRLQKVERAYGGHEVLAGVDWAIPPRSRIGLVGPNGSGKTTLLRLITGQEEPDRGSINITPGMTLGYLPQEGARLAEGTVLEAVLSPFANIATMEEDLSRLHDEMATATGRRLETLVRQSGELQHRFEAAGGFELETQAKIILGGLGFKPEDHARPLREFSGGFRMRASLGALLLRKPDYLLLDEPTNHLDLEAVTWLEGFLSDVPSAMIVVSHDRMFLNRLVSSIAEVVSKRVRVWAGNYDRYHSEREMERERALKKAAQEAHRIGEIERFVERFRYKATKARQVQSRIKMLKKMERTEVLAEDHSWQFSFPNVPRSAQRVALLAGVRKSYGERKVLDRLGLEIWRGDRIALVGPNGCGKSTLLRLIAGRDPADEGAIEIGEKVVLHYFAQHVLETLTPGRTVIDEMRAWGPERSNRQLRSLLGIFQFSGDDVFKRVEVLSGGEKNRLALARLTLDPGNFLLLDEPTNHLDLPTREALEDALAAFPGTLLFVSHDRYFINKVASRVAAFQDGRLSLSDGGYDDFLAASGRTVGKKPRARAAGGAGAARKSRGPAAAAPVAAPAPVPRPKGKERRRVEAEARNLRNRRLKRHRERIAGLESAIVPLERRLKEIEASMSSTDIYKEPGLAQHLGEEKKSIEIELAHLYDEWDDATSDLQEAEATLS
ncbi:MAG: ABC-F family ATP-binding cassette domain-containing protein [Acidobacteria bacterium]|nr:ABC-F family ATP-binding cassette domain-containing protein [Acidobacteriota bacterium]